MFAASKSGKAVAVSPVTTDPYFPYVSLLPETTGTNGQQNNTFLDSSTNNFTITRNGNSVQGSVTPYWPNGYWGNYFNGSTDYLTAPTNAAFAFGTGNFTVETYFNISSLTLTQCIVDTRLGSSSSAGFFLGIQTSGYVELYANAQLIFVNAGIVAGPWYHLALVRSSSALSLYINGGLITSVSNSTNWTDNACKIATSFTGNERLNGYLSNFRIVKGVAVYTSAFTPSTTPLTATQSANINGNPSAAITGTATSLLTSQSNRFLDNSANIFAITPSGTPKVQAVQPFNPASSYTTASYGGGGYFDGTSGYLSVPDNVALQLGSGDFTIEGWFYISGATSTAYNLISKGSATTGWSLNTTTSSRIQFSYTALNLTGATTTLVQNNWYHIAVVRSGTSIGNLKIYINGAQEVASTVAVLDNFNQTDTLYVSASRTATVLLNGYSSNIRIVKGTPVYTGAFAPPTLAPLTTAGSTSAASYSSTTNVNTSFASSSTSLLTNFTNAGIYDAAVQTNLNTSGNAQSSTTQYKWSPTSIRIDGTASTCVTFIDIVGGPADLSTGNGINSWTIECWIYYTAAGLVFNRGGNPGNTFASYSLSVSGGTGTFAVANSTGSAAGYTVTYSAGSIPTSTWVYWAATRTTAGVITTYINGVSQGSSGSGINIYNINNNQFALGATATPLYGISSILTGYIQDFRITKNIVRTITTPTAAFPTR